MLQYNCGSAWEIQAEAMFAAVFAIFRQSQVLLVGGQAVVAAVLSCIASQQHAIFTWRGIEAIAGIGLLGMEVEGKYQVAPSKNHDFVVGMFI